MFPGDEREIIHLAPAWPIVFTVYIWIWLSLTVTVLAVREQFRRRKQEEIDKIKEELEQAILKSRKELEDVPNTNPSAIFGHRESSHNDIPYSGNRDH